MNILTPVLLLATITVGEVLSRNFNGPATLPVVLHSGYLADTQEVAGLAAAKSAHLATLAHQSRGQSDELHGDLTYNLSHGHIADTHEVAAAKAEHFAAAAKARAGDYAAGYNHHSEASGAYHRYVAHSSYDGSLAKPVVLHNGHIADTKEVAAAKAEHFTAVAKARAQGGDYSNQYSSGFDHHSGASRDYQRYGTHDSYHGLLTKPVVLHDGHIADTHEVAAAKAEHFSAVAKARAHGGYKHDGDFSGQYAEGYDHYSGAPGVYPKHGSHGSYHGTDARPVVLPSGYLADTHEVAHAKQHHLQLLQSSRSQFHNY